MLESIGSSRFPRTSLYLDFRTFSFISSSSSFCYWIISWSVTMFSLSDSKCCLKMLVLILLHSWSCKRLSGSLWILWWLIYLQLLSAAILLIKKKLRGLKNYQDRSHIENRIKSSGTLSLYFWWRLLFFFVLRVTVFYSDADSLGFQQVSLTFQKLFKFFFPNCLIQTGLIPKGTIPLVMTAELRFGFFHPELRVRVDQPVV